MEEQNNDKVHHFRATGVFYVKVRTDIIDSEEPTIETLRYLLEQEILDKSEMEISVGEAEVFLLENKMR